MTVTVGAQQRQNTLNSTLIFSLHSHLTYVRPSLLQKPISLEQKIAVLETSIKDSLQRAAADKTDLEARLAANRETAAAEARAAEARAGDLQSRLNAVEEDTRARARELAEAAEAAGVGTAAELAAKAAEAITLAVELRGARAAAAKAEERVVDLEAGVTAATEEVARLTEELREERVARETVSSVGGVWGGVGQV